MIDQHRRGERQDIRLADRVTLEELQMGLLASLPLGDRLERVNVPTDELRERDCTVLLSSQRRRILEVDFSVPCPGQSRGPMCEGPGFPMDDRLAHALAHDRGLAGRAVRLPACLDRCHDGIGGDKRILSPLCLLRKR